MSPKVYYGSCLGVPSSEPQGPLQLPLLPAIHGAANGGPWGDCARLVHVTVHIHSYYLLCGKWGAHYSSFVPAGHMLQQTGACHSSLSPTTLLQPTAPGPATTITSHHMGHLLRSGGGWKGYSVTAPFTSAIWQVQGSCPTSNKNEVTQTLETEQGG